jgi:hypothetical protein
LDEDEHMSALRDYLVKKGIPNNEVVELNNKMLEGKYPSRQSYQTKTGILVTFPTPEHKAKAIAENPGKYTDKDPKPKKEEPIKTAPPGSKPEPGEKPSSKDSDNNGSNNLPKSDEKDIEDDGGDKEPTIFQGNKQLAIEPPGGVEKLAPPTAPPSQPPAPRTPQRIAAEKEIVKQIMNTDDTVLSNVADPVYEETCKYQLQELYKKADELGFKEAVKFLTPYVKS